LCANIAHLPASTTRSSGGGWKDDRERRAGRQVGNVMSAEKAEFKVSDQRHFAPDGTPRGPEREQRPPVVDGQVAGEERPPTTCAAEVAFSGFILSLAAQASSLLRGGDDGTEGDEAPARDKEGAQHIIAILEMLQDKTEGRRSADESRLLDGLLFELRMAYVALGERGAR
jgi:hypothetical protein